MSQQNPGTVYAAFGLAGQAGCLMVGIALTALVLGVVLDKALHTGHLLVFVFVFGSAPISLGLALVFTQRRMKKIIPPTVPKDGKAARIDDDEDR